MQWREGSVVSLDNFTDAKNQDVPGEEHPSPEPTAPEDQPEPRQLSMDVPPAGAYREPEQRVTAQIQADVSRPEGESFEGPPPQKRGPSKAATIVALAVVVMALVGVFALAAAAKLYLDRAAAVTTLDNCVSSMSELASAPGTPEALQRRVAWLGRAVRERDYEQAQTAINSLTDLQLEVAASSVPIPPGRDEEVAPEGHVPSPLEADELPQGAQQFFAENPKLWKAFLAFTRAAFRLREAGMNVDDLRAKRDSIIEAARLGQKDRVAQLLAEARELIGQKTGEDIPDEIKERLDRFARAFHEARAQRKDVRRAAALAESAQRAAQRGEVKRANELIDDAITALKEARPMRRLVRRPQPRRPERPEPPQPPQIGFLRYLAGSLTDLMNAEETDLARVWKSVHVAAGAVREKNADQVRAILAGAVHALEGIGVRRRMLARTLNEKEREAGARRAERGSPQPRPSRQEVLAQLRGRIGDVLAEVRQLTDEQFELYKDRLADQLVDAVLSPKPPGPGLVGPRPGALTPGKPMTAEERVRAKLQIAAEPYLQLKRTDADTGDLDLRFQEARQALAGGDYERAEELVDDSVAVMQKMLGQSRHGGTPGPLSEAEDAGPERLEYSTPLTQESGEQEEPPADAEAGPGAASPTREVEQ